MSHPDELIEAGFAALKAVEPHRTAGNLMQAARKQNQRARIGRAVAGAGSCLAVAAVVAMALKPTSALADLRDAARISASQPIVHLRVMTRKSTGANSSWEIWKFADHYVRKNGHVVVYQYRDGRLLADDDRFPKGFRSTYDAARDRFWTFDGTIGVELSGGHQASPTVRTVTAHDRTYKRYEWHDQTPLFEKDTQVDVDPESKLIRYLQSDTNSNGQSSRDDGEITYPTEADARAQCPHFSMRLKFVTDRELLADFHSRIGVADQSKTLLGIRTTLYGVVISRNAADGLRVEVITRGGAGPDYGSGHLPQVVGVPLLTQKWSYSRPGFLSPSQTRYGSFPVIEGRKYIVNESDDLLERAPSKITVRVPVWKLGAVAGGPHLFVGYVTFTTPKIFYNNSDSIAALYGQGTANRS